jgi:hypothetical protein
MLYKAENLSIDELDCGLDFFDPTDGRYEYRTKKERKNTDARHSPQSGYALLSLDSRSSSSFDAPASAVSKIRTNSQNLCNLC